MMTAPPTGNQHKKLIATALGIERILNQIALPLTATMLVAYFLPFLLLWENAYFVIHDNLDAEYAQLKFLAEAGRLLTFENAQIANVFNGIPRSFFRSPLDVTALLFSMLDAPAAYIVNHVLTHTIGFVGMYLLLTRHVIRSADESYVAAGVALAFAVVPFYSILGASVSAQPLLLYAFLNIQKGIALKRSMALVALFPFYASLVIIGPFILLPLGIWFIYDAFRLRKINIPFAAAIFLLVCMFVLTDYQLILGTLFSDLVSHRSVWPTDIYGTLNVRDSLTRSADLFFTTQYHAGQFQTHIILVTLAVAVALHFRGKTRLNTYGFMVTSIVGICLFYGFYTFLVHGLAETVPLLLSFQAHRFYFLLPLIWLTLFAITLSEIRRRPLFIPLVGMLLAMQIYAIALSPGSGSHEFRNNLTILGGGKIGQPTQAQFFAPDLFAQVEAYIGQPKSAYRVVSLGMPPSVAQFNGFYTLDSYQPNYALVYKERFRKVIEHELEKDEGLRKYYDRWGSRVYIFSSELGHNWLHVHTKVVRNLELNPAALRDLGAKYLLSAVPIENATQNSLQLLKTFRHPNSWWTVRLYQVH